MEDRLKLLEAKIDIIEQSQRTAALGIKQELSILERQTDMLAKIVSDFCLMVMRTIPKVIGEEGETNVRLRDEIKRLGAKSRFGVDKPSQAI